MTKSKAVPVQGIQRCKRERQGRKKSKTELKWPYRLTSQPRWEARLTKHQNTKRAKKSGVEAQLTPTQPTNECCRWTLSKAAHDQDHWEGSLLQSHHSFNRAKKSDMELKWPHPSSSNEYCRGIMSKAAHDHWEGSLLQSHHSFHGAKKSEIELNWPHPSPSSCNCSQPWLPHAVIALQTRKSVQILLFDLKSTEGQLVKNETCFQISKLYPSKPNMNQWDQKFLSAVQCTWMLNDADHCPPPDKRPRIGTAEKLVLPHLCFPNCQLCHICVPHSHIVHKLIQVACWSQQESGVQVI